MGSIYLQNYRVFVPRVEVYTSHICTYPMKHSYKFSFKVLEEYVRNFNFASRLRIFHAKKDISREGSLSFHTWFESPVTRKVRSLWWHLTTSQVYTEDLLFICLIVCLSVCLFVWFVCLFVRFISSHSRMDTSPLTAKGSKFWRMLGTYGHWAVRVFYKPLL